MGMIKFDINMLFGFIDVIVFYLLMKKFLFGRIKKVIDARKELIASQLKEAEDKNLEADKKLEDYENRIASCEAEGEEIIAAARKKANAEYGKIIDGAEAEAEAIKETARKKMEAEALKAQRESNEELTALAMKAAEKVIGKAVTAEDNSAIFDEFLSEGNNE